MNQHKQLLLQFQAVENQVRILKLRLDKLDARMKRRLRRPGALAWAVPEEVYE
jgi:hypothetical protein